MPSVYPKNFRMLTYGLMIVLFLAVVLLAAVLVSPAPVNRRNYKAIQVGMTIGEVEEVLGQPDQSLAPLTFQDLDADERPTLLAQTTPHTLLHWRRKKYMITVVLDSQGKVVGKSYSRD